MPSAATSPRLFPLFGLLGALAFSACSDDGGDTPSNNDTPDGGASVADAGLRALCPVPGNDPDCDEADECPAAEPVSINPLCQGEYCYDAYFTLCQLGRCTTPPRLEQLQTYEFRFDITNLLGRVLSFTRMAVAAETTGGNTISCAQVLADELDWTETCYNIMDLRYGQPDPMQVGGAIFFPFSRFTGGQRTLLIVYAFEEENAMGDPIAVVCEEVDVVDGGDMIPADAVIEAGAMTLL